MSDGRQASLKLSVSISSGSGTGNVTPSWDLIRWLRIVPIAETDSFDVTVKDGDGHIMLKRTANVGTFSEQVNLSLGIVKSVLLENATQDGTFTVKLDMH